MAGDENSDRTGIIALLAMTTVGGAFFAGAVYVLTLGMTAHDMARVVAPIGVLAAVFALVLLAFNRARRNRPRV